MKHHKWGKEKLRMVWLDDKTKSIYWGCPKTAPKCHLGGIDVSTILSIREGLVKAKKLVDQHRMENTFTIVTCKRTLELEAPTQEAKVLWMGFFDTLLS